MRVLIVESEYELGLVWKRAMMRLGVKVILVTTQTKAIQALRIQEFDLIVLDLVLENGSAFAISDFANYRRPGAKVMFVTNTSFFLTARFSALLECLRIRSKRHSAGRYRNDGHPLCCACLRQIARNSRARIFSVRIEKQALVNSWGQPLAA